MTSSTFEFDQATAVRLTETTASGAIYAIDVDAGFTVGPKPNGGYLLAAAARASAEALAAQGSDHRDALAATAHYLWAPDPGPASVTVEILRVGRGASQARATLEQDGRRCVDVTFTMGTLPPADTTAVWTGPAPLALPPIEDCIRIPASREGSPFVVSIMDRSALHMDPAAMQWAFGSPTGRGELRGWLAFADDRPVDSLGLLFFLDAFPPATFDIAPSGWVPTLSLTTYVRAQPAPGPLRVSQRVQSVDGGRVDEVCEIWDSTNRLVAHATQLAAIRFNDDTTVVAHPG